MGSTLGTATTEHQAHLLTFSFLTLWCCGIGTPYHTEECNHQHSQSHYNSSVHYHITLLSIFYFLDVLVPLNVAL